MTKCNHIGGEHERYVMEAIAGWNKGKDIVHKSSGAENSRLAEDNGSEMFHLLTRELCERGGGEDEGRGSQGGQVS